MGITNFYKEIKIKYKDAFNLISDETFEYLYIDMNCLLHKCNYNCVSVDDIIKKIIFNQKLKTIYTMKYKVTAKKKIGCHYINDWFNGQLSHMGYYTDSIKEAKKETAVDIAKKKLDALGVKYEMSATDKVRPFKAIYKPINKSDEFYDKFDDIVDLFNLKGVVKSSMNEAKKEDAVDTITMDIPLFLRMLEYSREDASQDMDLHDVTEKANTLGKERGILSMEDYDEIVGAAEDKPKDLSERIAEAFNKINEELCPAGKAYIKRRQAAGEKSSAYLSGRGVKVCKGQMSGKAKKKK